MRLLKAILDGVDLFKDGHLEIDLFASDRVVDESGVTVIEKPIYSQNIIGFAGINASGKTSTLRIMEFVLDTLMGKPVSDHLDIPSTLLLSQKSIRLKALFHHSGAYYLLDSELTSQNTDSGTTAKTLVRFSEETLWTIDGRLATKKALDDLKHFLNSATLKLQRSSLPAEVQGFLRDDISLVSSLTKNNGQIIAGMADEFSSIRKLDLFETRIVRAFDSSILSISDASDDDGEASYPFEVRFANGTGIYSKKNTDLTDVLSSGTIVGSNIVARSLGVLRTGGYLLLDEIENHLNKQLVNVVFDLFASKETNPHGAVLLFTTHYPEILDFIKRKDNIYFLVRNDEFRTEAIRYSDRIKRIENKKSEVFLSNYIQGTAPKYSEIAALKTYVKQIVDGGSDDR